MLSVSEKYTQSEVVHFWQDFSRQGLQACEDEMLARYAPALGCVLDLGCGCGRAGLVLIPRGYEVIGLDLSHAMLAAGRELFAQEALPATFVQGDLRFLPYTHASFDLALIFIAALQHITGRDNRQRVFVEVARALRPGGVLLLALDNLAPALTCYAWWTWRRLVSLVTGVAANEAPPVSAGPAPADEYLAINRRHSAALTWHIKGVARTLRWRTWPGWLDISRRLHLFGGEVGDLTIEQVSLAATPGRVYYHLYQHDELVADAVAGGFKLLGYHSGRELNERRTFSTRTRQLDKQILYAFQKA